ncbi:MAG: hypothetical protein AAF940_15630 [Pseudomonadota bacterium]
MEASVTTSTSTHTWEVVPANTLVGVILMVLFIYLFFRHFMFTLVFMDLLVGWLREYSWFPKEGKRLRTLIHWIIALALLPGFLLVAGAAGWVEFIPQ